jgi:hypothetical protein
MPHGQLSGNVIVSATLLISSEIDPKNVAGYTRAGFEVAFRPKAGDVRKYDDGRTSTHAKTKPFFSATNLYGAPEYVLRDDGGKWEPCRRHSVKLKAAALKDPCFDIYYHHREGSTSAWKPKPIRYALVVGLKAPSVPDFYNRVVRTFAKVLVPLRPKVQIQLRT